MNKCKSKLISLENICHWLQAHQFVMNERAGNKNFIILNAAWGGKKNVIVIFMWIIQ